MGLIKSAIGIGSLLCDGIGETIRVSLTDDPIREIAAALKMSEAAVQKRSTRARAKLRTLLAENGIEEV